MKLIKTLTSAAVVIFATSAFAVPVDLSSWSADGPGNWTLQSQNVPNDSVFQSLNSGPSMFYNGTNSQGMALSGTIEVQESGGDNDFVGFVLGYNANDLTAAVTDYILVDWKQGTQGGWDAGMAISRVTGSINAGGTDTTADAWDHVGNVDFIERAATLGNTGWSDNTEYMFDIIFTDSNIQVFIDNILQFDISGTFADGSFGFYNFSQPRVRYAGIEEDMVVPVPEPALLSLLGIGLLGFGLARRKRAV